MQIENLAELHDQGVFTGTDELKVGLLLQAINDWPHKIDTVEGFLTQVKGYLHVDFLTFDNIQKVLRELNPATSAWEMESLSSLLELLEIMKGQRLDRISIAGKAIDFYGGNLSK